MYSELLTVPEEQKPARSLRRISTFGIAALLLVILCSLCLLLETARHGRLVADDFGSASAIGEGKFLDAQKARYLGWSGRYSASALTALVHLSGPRAAQVVPILTVLWALFLVFIIPSLTIIRSSSGRAFRGMTIGAALAYALIIQAPSTFQVWIWTTGSITYVWPLLITATAGAVALGGRDVFRSWWLIPIAFFTAGFNETWMAVQVSAAIVSMATAIWWRRDLLRATIGFLVGSVLGAIIVAAAPGNVARSNLFQPPPIADAVLHSFSDTLAFMSGYFIHSRGAWVILVLTLLAGPAAGLHRLRWRHDAAATTVTILLVLAAILPSEVVLGQRPPGRAMFVPHVIVTLFVFYCAARLRAQIRLSGREWLMLTMVSLLLAILVTTETLPSSWWRLQRVRSFAHAWDNVDRTLDSASAGTELVVDAPGMVEGLIYLTTQHEHWANRAVARYYGIKSVRRLPLREVQDH